MGIERVNTRNGGLVLTVDGKTAAITATQVDRMTSNASLKSAIETRLGTTLPYQVLLHKNRDGMNQIMLLPLGEAIPTRKVEDEPDYTTRRTRTRT